MAHLQLLLSAGQSRLLRSRIKAAYACRLKLPCTAFLSWRVFGRRGYHGRRLLMDWPAPRHQPSSTDDIAAAGHYGRQCGLTRQTPFDIRPLHGFQFHVRTPEPPAAPYRRPSNDVHGEEFIWFLSPRHHVNVSRRRLFSAASVAYNRWAFTSNVSLYYIPLVF